MKDSSDPLKAHPQLVAIVTALLDGKTYSHIAREFALREAALREYAREAGFERIRVGEQEKIDYTAEQREAREPVQKQRQEGHREDPDNSLADVRRRQHEEQLDELAAIEAAQKAYEAQPMPGLSWRMILWPLALRFTWASNLRDVCWRFTCGSRSDEMRGWPNGTRIRFTGARIRLTIGSIERRRCR